MIKIKNVIASAGSALGAASVATFAFAIPSVAAAFNTSVFTDSSGNQFKFNWAASDNGDGFIERHELTDFNVELSSSLQEELEQSLNNEFDALSVTDFSSNFSLFNIIDFEFDVMNNKLKNAPINTKVFVGVTHPGKNQPRKATGVREY